MGAARSLARSTTSIGWFHSIASSPPTTVIVNRLSYHTLTNSPAVPLGVAKEKAKTPLLRELSKQGHHRQESLLASSSYHTTPQVLGHIGIGGEFTNRA